MLEGQCYFQSKGRGRARRPRIVHESMLGEVSWLGCLHPVDSLLA